MNNRNNCVKCKSLEEQVNSMKLSNLKLTDQLLLCRQENIALNHIRLLSDKSIRFLSLIIQHFSNNYLSNTSLSSLFGQTLRLHHLQQGVDGQQVDGQQVDVQQVDGQQVDGQQVDGQQVDVQRHNGQHDGQHINGQRVNGQSLNDQAVDGQPIDGQPVNGQPIDSQPIDKILKSLENEYKQNDSKLEDWFKQVDIIRSINCYPRFNVTRCDDEPTVRRPSRVCSPANQFMCLNESASETPTNKKSSNDQRLRCPFPKCSFSTRRELIGLKEHFACHERKHDENEIKPSVSDVALQSNSRSRKNRPLLRCSYPDCNYTSRWGMYQIRRHFKNMHTKKYSLNKSSDEKLSCNDDSKCVSKTGSNMKKMEVDDSSKNNSNTKKTVETDNSKSGSNTKKTELKDNLIPKTKSILRCSYPNCRYETCWGMNKLRLHMSRHMSQPKLRSHRISKTQTIVNSNSNSKAILKCNKCNFTTKWGMATFRKHMKIHNREKRFKCHLCDASYDKSHQLLYHKKQMHQSSLNQSSLSQSSLSQSSLHQSSLHQSTLNQSTLNQSTLNQSTLNQSTLNQSTLNQSTLNQSSSNSLDNSCNICYQSFDDSSHLKRHQAIHQRVDEPETYECPHDNCLFKTNISEIFRKHVMTHLFKNNEPKESEEVEEAKAPNKRKHDEVEGNGVEDPNVGSCSSGSRVQLLQIKVEKSSEDEEDYQLAPIEIPDNFVSESTPKGSSDKSCFSFGSHLIRKSINRSSKANTNSGDKSKSTDREVGNSEENELHNETPITNRLSRLLKNTNSSTSLSFSPIHNQFSPSHNQFSPNHSQQSIRRKNKVHKCNQCKKTYRRFSQLEAHRRLKNHLYINRCNCGQQFVSVSAFEKHKNHCNINLDILARQERYHCDYPNCNKSFANIRGRRRHIKRVHKARVVSVVQRRSIIEEKELQIDSYNNIETEQQPMNSEREDTWSTTTTTKCPVINCNTRHKTKVLMIAHFNKYHKGVESQLVNITDESSRCPLCGMLFANAGNMRRHKTLAHKHSDNMTHELFNSFNSYNTSFVAFNTSYTCDRLLEQQSKSITSENSYHNLNLNRCQFCEVIFDNLVNLDEHVRSVHYRDEQMRSVDVDFNQLPISSSSNLYNRSQLTVEQNNQNTNTFNSIVTNIKIEQL